MAPKCYGWAPRWGNVESGDVGHRVNHPSGASPALRVNHLSGRRARGLKT